MEQPTGFTAYRNAVWLCGHYVTALPTNSNVTDTQHMQRVTMFGESLDFKLL